MEFIPKAIAIATEASIVLGILAVLLIGIDRLLDKNDREFLRHKVENFWFRTAGMEIHEQFQLALKSRYARMREIQPLYLFAFAIVGVALVGLNVVINFREEPASVVKAQMKIIDLDFNLRKSFYFSGIDFPHGEPLFEDADERCIAGKGVEGIQEIARLVDLREKLRNFLATHSDDKLTIRTATAIVSGAVVLLVSLPLGIGLYFSFQFTLWLLSRVTRSKLGAALLVVFDLVLALIAPPLVSGILLTALAFIIVFAFGSVPDFSIFNDPSWTTIAISSTGVLLSVALGGAVLVSLLSTGFPIWLSGILFAVTVVFNSYQIAKTFFVDVLRAVHFDTHIGSTETLINYAIGIDLAFSLTYILPCLTLVLMQRSPLTRRLFLNFVQWIAEHPKGPFVAAAEVATFSSRYILNLLKKAER